MKILILANNDVGLYNFRKELLEKLLEEKHSVFIALPGGDKVIPMMRMGCVFYQVEIDRRGTNLFKDLLLLKSYFSLIQKVQPDVVFTYTIKPNIYGGIVCRFLHKKYIVNITGLGTAVENGGCIAAFVLLLYKIAMKKAACVFFQNTSNMRKMIALNIIKGKMRLIPGSGVNLKFHTCENYPKETENISFLFLGRILKNKGVEELFTAAGEIKKLYPNVRFKMAGYCEEDYSKQLQELEQDGTIEYLGFQSDVHTLIKESFAVVLPSYYEGMSNVLLEASASGRPLIASRIPGCLEILDEGVNGIAFEAKSSESLKSALLKFINLSYADKKKMGLKAREKVEKEFDRNIVVNAYLDEIDHIDTKEIAQ